jgi:hypothetical protein
MAGFGTELILFCGLGYILLGPKRMHAILQRIARAKHEFDKTRQAIESQLSAGVEANRDPPSG